MNPNQLPQFDSDTLAKIKLAQSQGHDPAQILQKASQYQASKSSVQPSQPQAQQPQVKSSLLDLLPLIGAIGGSFIPGLGTVVGGAVGAGAGTLGKELLGNKPINTGEVIKESALAGLGGVVGKGLGFVGSKLFPGIAEGAGNLGERLAAKAFRVTPRQATEFSATTGEPLGKFLASRGIGKLEDAVARADSLQGHFDNVVLSKNLKIEPNNILQEFSDRIEALRKSTIPAQKAKADQLEQIAQNFINQHSSTSLSADALTNIRREVDSVIKKFPLDENVKGPLNMYRDVLQESLRKAADKAGISAVEGQSLKDTGVELSKLYKAIAIGEKQSNLGAGSMPAGITNLLAGAGGFAAGGPAGAAGAIAGKEAINNPATLGLLSKFSTKVGQAAGQVPALSPTALAQLPRVGVMAGALPASPVESAMNQQSTDISANPLGQFSGENMPQSDNQDQQLRQVLASLMFSKAKSVGDIKTAYEMMQSPVAKPLTAEQQKLKANAESGLSALDKITAQLAKDPYSSLESKIPILKGRNPYTAASKEIQDVLTRLRTGAALNKEEQAFYESQLPQPLDSPEVIQYKLSLFKNLFTRYAYGQTPASPDVITVPQNQ